MLSLRSDHNSGNDKGSDVEIRKFLILEISAHTSANEKSVRLYMISNVTHLQRHIKIMLIVMIKVLKMSSTFISLA